MMIYLLLALQSCWTDSQVAGDVSHHDTHLKLSPKIPWHFYSKYSLILLIFFLDWWLLFFIIQYRTWVIHFLSKRNNWISLRSVQSVYILTQPIVPQWFSLMDWLAFLSKLLFRREELKFQVAILYPHRTQPWPSLWLMIVPISAGPSASTMLIM